MIRLAATLALGLAVAGCGSRSRLLGPGTSSGGSAGGGSGGAAGVGGGGGGSGGVAGTGGAGGSPSACVYDDLALGGDHTCVLDPTGAVLCFGANQFGQLGSGKPGSAATVPVPIVGPSDFVGLGAGEFHSSGVRADGSMMGWGHNPLGVLGDGTTEDQAAPVVVKGMGGAVAISSGMVASHACAVHQNGSVSCWGQNSHGQLGTGTLEPSLTPKPVIGLKAAIAVAVGYIFSCAAESSGTVRCWGWNASGALGIGNLDAKSYPTPVPVAGVSGAVQVVAGNHYGCARTASGAVYCWGYNGSGQLGIGSGVENSPTAAPVVGLTDAVWLSGGQSHACAVRKGGTVRCWGRNYFGQLGDGTTVDQDAPVTVVGVVDAARVSAGGEHTCALRSSGELICWGANGSGQLGNGKSEPSPLAVKAGCSLAACGGADESWIKSHFMPCDDGEHIGQVASAPGVTCEQVCCVFGRAGCAHRAAQAGFDACVPANPAPTGACSDVLQAQWSSACACL
ncbi:MAG: hypothetical protein IT377_20725 [Polyangiaceae bacterium]|nr:hypothetical protein [Polyangiaceae bacterium]